MKESKKREVFMPSRINNYLKKIAGKLKNLLKTIINIQ